MDWVDGNGRHEMKRLIDAQLADWKNHHRRKPLILRGARQVGKTHTVNQLAKDHFNDQLIAVDLEKNRQLHSLFGDHLDPRKIISALEVIFRKKIIPGKTLLFIDEIQSCPRALTALRYFYEEYPDLHVVAAGSLLEFALRDISFPVGRVQFMEMYPMNFGEFLLAGGNRDAADIVWGNPGLLPDAIHDFLLEELRKYFCIGGMPESVKAYIETQSMLESFRVQEEICESYRQDFSKYAPYADKRCLDIVLHSVARRAGQQMKYSRLAEDYSNPTIKKAFDLLVSARVIRRIPSADPSGLPLGASASSKKFKAVLVDIGLMRHLCGLQLDLAGGDLLGLFRGAQAEQFVGQEMIMSQKGKLYYWARSAKSSTAEVDYLAQVDGKIYPVEVKSSVSGRLRSMHLFLSNYSHSPNGIVFSTAVYSELQDQKLLFLPIYYAFSATRSSRFESVV